MACPICLDEACRVRAHPTRDADQIACDQCGEFLLSRTASANLQSIDHSIRWRISAAIREHQLDVVSSSDIENAQNSPVPGLLHRADRMLREINSKFPNGGNFSVSDVRYLLIAIGWNRNVGETRYMLEEVLERELGYLRSTPGGLLMRVTAKGLLHLEAAVNKESHIGFCAMWFDQEVNPLWISVIEKGIRSAGYEPLRIDVKQHNGKIDDEIMASIRGARFVVADFTGNRGGVYYEAGFAHGLGLPVIFMCREGDDLHFDIRQYNCIFWKSDQLDEAKTRLTNRIRATLGQGPVKVQ